MPDGALPIVKPASLKAWLTAQPLAAAERVVAAVTEPVGRAAAEAAAPANSIDAAPANDNLDPLGHEAKEAIDG